jgi:hypothetical protein
VCIGAKDSQYGKFLIPSACQIIHFKLVYVSGGGLSYYKEENKGYWGGTYKGESEIQMHITNSSN